MIKRELKEKAIELRKSGSSYNEITRETGISKGMLSYWFSKEKWSEDVFVKNKQINLKESRDRLLILNKIKLESLQEKYLLIKEEAAVEFENFKNDPLFVAALMLYLGEGDKSDISHNLRIANIDPSVLQIFIRFILTYCHKTKQDIRFWVLCYPDLDIQSCESWWIEKLGLSKENLYKTQVIQGKHKTKRLRYGVGNIIIPKKALRVKVLKWIELASSYLMRA